MFRQSARPCARDLPTRASASRARRCEGRCNRNCGMGHPRRFRFAVDLHNTFSNTTWTDTVRQVEAMGYSALFVPDHFDEGFGPIAAMAAAAAVTTTIKIGSLVLDCDFRHPAVLSRELATIDVLAEGRLELGLGAG